MAITHIASAQGFRSGAGTTVATAATMGATQVGDLLCVAGITNGTAGVTLTISDSQANTWFTANPIFTGSTTDRGQSWYAFAKNTTATTPTITSSASTSFAVVMGEVFRGTDQTSAVLGVHNETSGSGNPTSGSLVLDANDCAIWAWSTDSITAVGNIDGSAATKGADDTQNDWSEYRILTGRNGQSITAAFTGSGVFTIGTVAWRPPQVTATLDQYGYRGRNDDGTEVTATWKAAQNTSFSITPDTRFRLRFGVNTPGDPPSKQFKVQYRKVGDPGWLDVDTAG